ncbi:MAG TPA: lipoprotein [Candidatus Competibacteraceae bacterium]|nr:lipoprotein [Candidatus Competibacteraceae bacterium]HQA25701.1 lipoprotein [Candidatus Competibacteraceae bacterium]HQD57641.1 lipoprotein [Candidatus Competibacteraceae bacterium]
MPRFPAGRVLAWLTLAMLAVGCGQKGPLYLPKPSSSEASSPPPTTEPAPAQSPSPPPTTEPAPAPTP